jgi:hypothetical protein
MENSNVSNQIETIQDAKWFINSLNENQKKLLLEALQSDKEDDNEAYVYKLPKWEFGDLKKPIFHDNEDDSPFN